jgi:HPr kinase/phosphorylase
MSATFVSRPGVMLEVLGQGVLLQGESGIGKSDLALGLVARGHRLVADDLVEFERRDEQLHGRARQGCAGFLEVGGLGIINLHQLYGSQTVCAEAPLTLVLSLENELSPDYDGLQPVAFDWRLLELSVPAWRLPCTGKRDMPLIVETAVRLNQARQQGYDACSELQSSLNALMRKGAA